MKKGLIAGIAVFLASGYAIASPYITCYQIKSAAEDKDGEALSRHIDFPALRQNFKDQMNAHMAKELAKESDNGFGAILGSV
ncbi:hypothetical protein FHR95_001965 [Halomonas fontilapidosi]|uniref:Uncharacterized protein n=1 Tax=Halomonas fontilapidosi TaxID=616675 RepID=A0A7W5DL16_9GAMM|nr:DUF2939 domain-containing protein [Halomonas fontilapidosi]MBB3184404.1 hypothetical protein [Halomonas fontilapidosi]